MDKLIFNQLKFHKDSLGEINNEYLKNYPIIYILYGQGKLQAYIGETTSVVNRMNNHLNNPKRRKAEMTEMILIGHEKFNQSATYNLETNLISAFIADQKYQIQNVSQTRRQAMHNYYEKQYYHKEVFEKVWKTLKDNKVVNHELKDLENKDIFKLSPYQSLSSEQYEIKEKIINYCKKHINDVDRKHIYAIKGDAGTGKSVVLMSIFNTIQDLAHDDSSALKNTNNFLLVQHAEMIKTYKSIASSLPNIKKKNILKPTEFINKKAQADVVFVDEAHLLLTQPDKYNNFKQDNQLTEIVKLAKVVVCIFDANQVLRTQSYWNEAQFEAIISQIPNVDHTMMELTTQFRMNNAVSVSQWIEAFVKKKQILPFPDLSKTDYDFRIFDSPEKFKRAIEERNKQYNLSRIVATFDYEHKKNGDSYLVDLGGIPMPWNSTNDKRTWAEIPETIHEVGSIYTVQGFDLNYVGVILGPSLDYDITTNQLVVNIEQNKDTGGKRKRRDVDNQLLHQEMLEKQILNAVNVLMTRGVKGLYLYPANDSLRQKLLSIQANGHQNH